MTLVNWHEHDREFRGSLKKMTDSQLADAFCKCLVVSAESYRRAALLMREAEERGVDFRPIARNLHPILMKIAHDQLLPEVIVFCGTKDKLRLMLERLSIPDQRKVLEAESLPLAEDDTERMVDPRQCEPWQLKQLFAEDHVRPVDEQRRWLRNKAEATQEKTQRLRIKGGKVDRASMTIALPAPRGTSAELGIIEAMAKENGWPKWYATRRFFEGGKQPA